MVTHETHDNTSMHNKISHHEKSSLSGHKSFSQLGCLSIFCPAKGHRAAQARLERSLNNAHFRKGANTLPAGAWEVILGPGGIWVTFLWSWSCDWECPAVERHSRCLTPWPSLRSSKGWSALIVPTEFVTSCLP